MDYKDKLRLAKEALESGSYDKETIEYIFPELKESGDERIRKALIDFFLKQFDYASEEGTKERLKSWIAWLEKQGEQKPEELPNGEDYGIDSLYHAARILEKTLGEVDGYQSDDGILEHKCAIEVVKRLYEQKPAWSEEDEKIKYEIEVILANTDLSKLKLNYTFFNMISWLKFLKDRYTWKPSEEQITALEASYSVLKIHDTWCEDEHLPVLMSLINDLKKL